MWMWLVYDEQAVDERYKDTWVDSVWDTEREAEMRATVIRERLPDHEVEVVGYELNCPDGEEMGLGMVGA